MHRGEFIGNYAKDQKVRILILGESHHWSTDDKNKETEERLEKERAYATSEVVENYLKNYNNNAGKDRDQAYRFFENIVRTFGIDPNEHRTDFWDQVYFGNYIDTLCGVRDNIAKKLLKIEENRRRYNEQLFRLFEKRRLTSFSALAAKFIITYPLWRMMTKRNLMKKKILTA